LDERFAVLDAPGVFRDMAHGFRTVHDPAFKAAFWGVGEAKGVKLIGLTCDTGTDYATKAPLRALADFKNLKLRIFGSKLEVEALARLGAAGVPMPLSDALPALQNNQIDGVRSGIPVFVPFKYESVAKYILKEKESFVFTGKYVSLAWLGRLPADLRTAVIEEAAAADPTTQDFAIKYVESMYAQWQQKGGTLTELSAAEQKELRSRFAGVGPEAFKDRPQAMAVFNVMTAAAARLANN
ncbi:MAG: TRAP transporter substrate-binding protein DctP, partial [Rhodospirillaceae bacterium]